ncbi:MAG: FAD-binding oxidoreductase [Solirubrobacteraceae bacterium]
MARRKVWGWGVEGDAPGADEVRGLRTHLGFGRDADAVETPTEPRLPPPRVGIPAELSDAACDDAYDRARYGLGRSYLDVVRGMRGEIAHPPDFVVHAWTEDTVIRTLEWAAARRVAVTPVGGGTSVVGGIEAHPIEGGEGAIALALGAMDRVLEVDTVSRAARIQAGATGPRLEEQLRVHGLTLRFYPQSFELATLGGWLATRAGGHFATGPTHIDDLVQGIRAVTPGAGVWQSRRLPGSGAGPSPDRLLLGSEGTLGVITEAWVRVQPRPTERRSASIRFPDYFAAARAVRDIVQSGLRPANCRVIDAREAALTFADDGSHALLLLGFESGLDDQFQQALTIAGGEPRISGGGAGEWKDAFLRAPYLRDTFVVMGVLSETFESAITWDRHDAFVREVQGTAEAVLRERCGAGSVTVRMTHAYPDGAAPYFTCLAPVEQGAEVDTWRAVKHAASEAILRGGGSITHHHAVGRDHRPWYERQRPEPFAAALRGAKAAVDPVGILNPGVLSGASPPPATR